MTQIDYNKSPAPQFDAVEDVRTALGEDNWIYWRNSISRNPDAHRDVQSWLVICRTANISHPFQISAWYDHYFGQGAWDKVCELESQL